MPATSGMTLETPVDVIGTRSNKPQRRNYRRRHPRATLGMLISAESLTCLWRPPGRHRLASRPLHIQRRPPALHISEQGIHHKGDSNPRDDEVGEKQNKEHDQAHGHRHLRLDQVADRNRKEASNGGAAGVQKGSHGGLLTPSAALLL